MDGVARFAIGECRAREREIFDKVSRCGAVLCVYMRGLVRRVSLYNARTVEGDDSWA